MREWLRAIWCSWTHGGGRIKRDPQGRINWQCDKCHTWAEPVSADDEAKVIDRSYEERLAFNRTFNAAKLPPSLEPNPLRGPSVQMPFAMDNYDFLHADMVDGTYLMKPHDKDSNDE